MPFQRFHEEYIPKKLFQFQLFLVLFGILQSSESAPQGYTIHSVGFPANVGNIDGKVCFDAVRKVIKCPPGVAVGSIVYGSKRVA